MIVYHLWVNAKKLRAVLAYAQGSLGESDWPQDTENEVPHLNHQAGRSDHFLGLSSYYFRKIEKLSI